MSDIYYLDSNWDSNVEISSIIVFFVISWNLDELMLDCTYLQNPQIKLYCTLYLLYHQIYVN